MKIENRAQMRMVLDGITFGPSGVMLDRMDLQWETEPIAYPGGGGWLIRCTFMRPDTVTGDIGRGAGRWEFVAHRSEETSLVKTCWLLLELLVRHELMESFIYRGAKIFDPHKTVAQLAGD